MRTTEKQKAAVLFCEQQLNIKYTGNINNPIEVSKFLSEFLSRAKTRLKEINYEYSDKLDDIFYN